MACTRCIIPWQFYQHDMYYFHSFTSMMCTSGSFTSMTCTTLSLTVYQHDNLICTTLTVYCHDMYYSDSFISMMCTTLTVLPAWCVLLWVLPAWHVLLLTVLPAWCILFWVLPAWHVLFWQFYQHDMYYSDSFTSMTCTTLTPTLSLTCVNHLNYL